RGPRSGGRTGGCTPWLTGSIRLSGKTSTGQGKPKGENRATRTSPTQTTDQMEVMVLITQPVPQMRLAPTVKALRPPRFFDRPPSSSNSFRLRGIRPVPVRGNSRPIGRPQKKGYVPLGTAWHGNVAGLTMRLAHREGPQS